MLNLNDRLRLETMNNYGDLSYAEKYKLHLMARGMSEKEAKEAARISQEEHQNFIAKNFPVKKPDKIWY